MVKTEIVMGSVGSAKAVEIFILIGMPLGVTKTPTICLLEVTI